MSRENLGFGSTPMKKFMAIAGSYKFAQLGEWEKVKRYKDGVPFDIERMRWNRLHVFRYYITHIVTSCHKSRSISHIGGRINGKVRLSAKHKKIKYIKVFTPEEVVAFWKAHPKRFCAKCFGLGSGRYSEREKRWMEEMPIELDPIKQLFLPTWLQNDIKKETREKWHEYKKIREAKVGTQE